MYSARHPELTGRSGMEDAHAGVDVSFRSELEAADGHSGSGGLEGVSVGASGGGEVVVVLLVLALEVVLEDAHRGLQEGGGGWEGCSGVNVASVLAGEIRKRVRKRNGRNGVVVTS